MSNLGDYVYLAVALLVGLTVHEAAHAYIADRLGDPTARRLGRVTLNPIAHLDPAGTLMMVFAIIAQIGIGWGKPVPVNPSNLRPDPKTGNALVAAAGPISNLLMATILALLVQRDIAWPSTVLPLGSYAVELDMISLLSVVIGVNVSLALFNLIPIPPLDGFSVLLGLLPNGPAYSLSRLYQYGPGLLLLLIFFGQGLIRGYLSFFSVPIYQVFRLLG